MTIDENINKIKEIILREKRILRELNPLFNYYANSRDEEEKEMINLQIRKLQDFFRNTNNEFLKVIEEMGIKRPLDEKEEIKKIPLPPEQKTERLSREATEGISDLEKDILKRLKRGKEKVVEKKIKRPSAYVNLANRIFSESMRDVVKKKRFVNLEKDLIKSNLEYTASTYFSVVVFTTILAAIVAVLVFVFFLLFDLHSQFPIITPIAESLGIRFLKIFWIIFVIPSMVFLLMYTYPSLERRSLESKIDQELPFATINMAAIAGSLIDPTRIFRIISATKEYPNLEREFNKLMNKINIYGYDLVTALKDSAVNCASQKLSELFNGLATTITSGGGLYDFFDKRAQSLLFEYRLEKEKSTKAAETFMDIYISVVIAAPMILMLLLMMIRISGLGISLSTGMISFLVVGGVSLINILFLSFLQVKQQGKGE